MTNQGRPRLKYVLGSNRISVNPQLVRICTNLECFLGVPSPAWGALHNFFEPNVKHSDDQVKHSIRSRNYLLIINQPVYTKKQCNLYVHLRYCHDCSSIAFITDWESQNFGGLPGLLRKSTGRYFFVVIIANFSALKKTQVSASHAALSQAFVMGYISILYI